MRKNNSQWESAEGGLGKKPGSFSAEILNDLKNVFCVVEYCETLKILLHLASSLNLIGWMRVWLNLIGQLWTACQTLEEERPSI